MTGQSKKTQSTLNKSFFSRGETGRNITSSENRNANKNIHSSFDNLKRKIPPSSSQSEIEELKQEISDLQMKCKELAQLTQQNNYMLLQSKVEKLEQENKQLRFNNDELTKHNKNLQVQIDNYEFLDELVDDVSQNEVESDDLIRPAKRMRKKPSDEDEKAKTLMRTLLKTFPPELNLKDEETFRSKTNVEICQKLIPRLQKEMKAYNPTYEQVDIWLQSIHRSKRGVYLKSNPLNNDDFDYLREAESYSAIQSSKQQKKLKESKQNNFFFEDEDELKIEEGAKTLMKALLNTYPHDFTLKIEDTFKSKVNMDICEKLIPKLQREVKSAYNLSYEQVENWLQTFHRSKRTSYLKANPLNQSYSTSLNYEFDNSQEAEYEGSIRSAKQQTKSKGRKSGNLSDDEELKIEEGAKVLMRSLIKNFPSEFNLRDEETFRSVTNFEICQKLIPKLQREVKPAYELSYQQVETWLQNFHKTKRKNYLKAFQMEID